MKKIAIVTSTRAEFGLLLPVVNELRKYEDNELKINYYGKSTKDTIANMTNHSYFNLSGHNSRNSHESRVIY